jgi:GxxExxY protein
MSQALEDLASLAVDAGFQIHKALGPGLLESAYEAILVYELQQRKLKVERQIPIGIRYKDIVLDNGFRADLLIENVLLIELKSVEHLQSVHAKQLLTYLRLMDLPLGLLMNFGAATYKEGVKRIVNNYQNFAA